MAALPLLRDVPPLRKPVSANRPDLVVIKRRRRWPAFVGAVVSIVVFAGLLGAAVFHTQLAERQLKIDRLETSVVEQRELFDDLRYQRAQLRSPGRLSAAAAELGMKRGAKSEFIAVSPEQLAQQLAAAGVVDDGVVEIIVRTEPLDQFRDVKAVTAGQP